MTIDYQIFESESLLIHRFSGIWSTERYEEYLTMSVETLNLEVVKKILTDLRDIDIQPAFGDAEKIAGLRNKIPIKEYKNIQIVTSPVLTVAANIYQSITNQQKKIVYQYCSTIGYALNFLKLAMSEDEMETRIKNLANHF